MSRSPALSQPHERALALLFTEIAHHAMETRAVLLGTAGTITQRSNAEGKRYWVRRYSDASGARREHYLGGVEDPAAEKRVATVREQIAAVESTMSSIRLLIRNGFAAADKKTYSTIASMHNHGLFAAGAFLIGSHAYGALLNALGVRAVSYSTEDIDVARHESLALPTLPSFLDMLRESGVAFVEVPQLDHRAPPVSFKERGVSRFRVDLLVPTARNDYPVVAVPELQAHATGLPYLAYLLGASQMLPVLSPHGAVAVRVPVPERFALHKLLVSQLRGAANPKVAKDLHQAATLISALADQFPGALEDAAAALPASARRPIRRAVKSLHAFLPDETSAAREVLESISR